LLFHYPLYSLFSFPITINGVTNNNRQEVITSPHPNPKLSAINPIAGAISAAYRLLTCDSVLRTVARISSLNKSEIYETPTGLLRFSVK